MRSPLLLVTRRRFSKHKSNTKSKSKTQIHCLTQLTGSLLSGMETRLLSLAPLIPTLLCNPLKLLLSPGP